MPETFEQIAIMYHSVGDGGAGTLVGAACMAAECGRNWCRSRPILRRLARRGSGIPQQRLLLTLNENRAARGFYVTADV